MNQREAVKGYSVSKWGSLAVKEDFCPVNHLSHWMPAQNSREGNTCLRGRGQGSRECLLEMGASHTESYTPWATHSPKVGFSLQESFEQPALRGITQDELCILLLLTPQGESTRDFSP